MASIILLHSLFLPVVTFILVNLLTVALRSDPAAVFGPSAFYLLIRIQFRLREITELVVHVHLMAPVITFLLMYVLSPPWHVYHAAVSPKLALHQFFGIATIIDDRHGRETVADIVYTLESIFIDAILLVNAASPRHRSYPASCCRIRAFYQVIAAVISRHMFFLQVRSKLTPEIIII